MGRVRNNQFIFGTLTPNLRNSFESKGERRYIHRKEKARSKIAYPPNLYFLRNSIVIIEGLFS
jgi:hypothetical protein